MIDFIFSNMFGIILTIGGWLDAYKYKIEANKIRKIKSSKSISRKFINIALFNDLIRLIYFITVDKNIYLLISAIFSLFFMLDMFYAIYFHYPYKCRGLIGFKRPNIVRYFINSLVPNKIRQRL